DAILANRSSDLPPPLLVGDLSAARSAFVQPERTLPDGRSVAFEVFAPRRFGLSTLAWWFRLARGFEFSSSAAIEKILLRTGGIPDLVTWIDDNLVRRDPAGAGLDVLDGVLDDSLTEFDRALSGI